MHIVTVMGQEQSGFLTHAGMKIVKHSVVNIQ
jgi:hypothetical protein